MKFILLTFTVFMTLSLRVQATALEFVIPDVAPLKSHGHIVVADIPYLYHWTSISSLKRLSQDAVPGKFPFKKKIATNTMLSGSFPQLTGLPGLFAWVNPVGGIGVSAKEMYADENEPALIRVGLRRNLRILILESKVSGGLNDSVSVKNVDIIFHSREWTFHEFIIINPEVITEFTADPAVLKSDILKTEALFVKQDWMDEASSRLVVASDLFNFFGELDPEFIKLVVPRIDKYLGSGKLIPPLFKSSGKMSRERVLN